MAPVVRGAQAVAVETVILRRRSQVAALALLDGALGVIVAPGGRLLLALAVRVENHRIAGYEVIADPARLRQLDVAALRESPRAPLQSQTAPNDAEPTSFEYLASTPRV